MADENKKNAINEDELKKLQEAVEAAKPNITEDKKGFLAFVWKWVKRLALPIGIVLGYILRMLTSGGGSDSDDDVDELDAVDSTEE